MKNRWSGWVLAGSLLIGFILIERWIPLAPFHFWGLFSLKKILRMLWALTVIQLMSSKLIRFLGVRSGVLATGFLGGLISSTAFTAHLARRSKDLSPEEASIESLAFLSSLLAMLMEAFVLVCIGLNQIHWHIFILFVGPIVATIIFIITGFRHASHIKLQLTEEPKINILSILKLAAFITLILALSKFLQTVLGQGGLLILTFLVSLFEIHSSVIANVQLHEIQSIGVLLLGNLLGLSLTASYISKIFLVFTLGSASLKKKTTWWSTVILISLFFSWIAFYFFLRY